MIEVKETDDGLTITNEIAYTVQEEFDRFVFKTVEPYLKDVTKTVISKEILVRALICFANEHPEELKQLQEKMKEENIQ
jgi:hypothetical protein